MRTQEYIWFLQLHIAGNSRTVCAAVLELQICNSRVMSDFLPFFFAIAFELLRLQSCREQSVIQLKI